MFPNAEYNAEIGLTQKEIDDSKLLDLGYEMLNTHSASDLIIGEINGVSFKASDVEIVSVGKRESLIKNSFCGRLYIFDFYKNFKSNLILIQPGQNKPLLYNSYSEVDYEAIDFNVEFKIYSNNQQEAFYLITPHLMEKLLELDNLYKDKISFSFDNSKLYVAVDKGELSFSQDSFTQLNEHRINHALKDLDEIKDLVEFLSLDNTLFKKK